ncbi:MAG: hypothetical protein J7501_10635 [Bdellovibrio sp.]|nr:hypothetical protein [Bdellovibrio sp.]
MKRMTIALTLLICSMAFANEEAPPSSEVPAVTSTSSTKVISTTTTVTSGVPVKPKRAAKVKKTQTTNGYEFKFEVLLDGKPASQPLVHVKAGQPASFEIDQPNGDKTAIELTAKDDTMDGKPGILIDLIMANVSKNGSKLVFATPKLMVFDDSEEAEISISAQRPGQADIKIKVIAARKSL